ncbi:MAG: CehA/McbA family metallohydrolase [Parasphingopyxis sp.]|uniref:CehA/McbA family metallohydrolase n=1 Tax=Parasphingopyxis sp. TaxID=1920299 RepID=UPI003F9FFA21
MKYAIIALVALFIWERAANAQTPDMVLTGTISGTDHQSYIERRFAVPDGVTALTVTFEYDRDANVVIDLGLFDGERFRGWSGGNKARFTVGITEATPSYLAGAMPAGEWTLILGVPNAGTGASADYRAEIVFDDAATAPAGFAEAPIRSEPDWYRGDFHAHTGHSDGMCASMSGARSPCPLYRSVAAAADRGLDFIAITEHNTISHFGEMRALQPAFDRLLLVPGREITTFYGHANLFGPTGFIDFRLGSEDMPTMDAMLDQAEARGGLFSINHPGLPSDARCMGCGWTAENTDWSRIGAIEIANGGAIAAAGGVVESPISGIPFWHELLNQGYRITGIGGSDNHNAQLEIPDPRAIGRVSTAVWARGLSLPALIEGVRSGRVFIDLVGPSGRILDLAARAGDREAVMGDSLAVRDGETIAFRLTVSQCSTCTVEIIRDGAAISVLADEHIVEEGTALVFELPAPERHSWVRANVRDRTGRLLIIGNPIYLSSERQ